MNQLYIVFLSSPYKIGKFIRFVTGQKYNHVALSKDIGLSTMYSFARKHLTAPLMGGFVIERPDRYTFIKNSSTTVKISRIQLSDSEYLKVLSRIDKISRSKSIMKYNFLSAIFYSFGKPFPVKNAYTCVEFIQYILGIRDFVSLEGLQLLYTDVVYEGSIDDIVSVELCSDDYFKKIPLINSTTQFIYDFSCLIGRTLKQTFLK